MEHSQTGKLWYRSQLGLTSVIWIMKTGCEREGKGLRKYIFGWGIKERGNTSIHTVGKHVQIHKRLQNPSETFQASTLDLMRIYIQWNVRLINVWLAYVCIVDWKTILNECQRIMRWTEETNSLELCNKVTRLLGVRRVLKVGRSCCIHCSIC